MENALNAAQVLFTANPLFLAPQTEYLWGAQARILDEVERFSSAWFRRRHEAAQSLIEASRRIVAEGRADPASAMKEIADWQHGSMERLREDAQEYSRMLGNCATAFSGNDVEAAEETGETAKRIAKPGKSKSG